MVSAIWLRLKKLFGWIGRHAAPLVATCALIVSITTIVFQISFWNAQREDSQLQRLHDELSAAPSIQLLASPIPTQLAPKVGMSLLNLGGGAAIMKEIQIYVDEEPTGIQAAVEVLQALINATGSEEEWKNVIFTSSGWETLPPRAEQLLIEFPLEAWTPDRGKIFRSFFARMTIEVSYESIYGKAFTKTFTPYRTPSSSETTE